MDEDSNGQVRVQGGTFSGVTTFGQGNDVRVGTVNTGIAEGELEQLRRLVGELVEHLRQSADAGAEHVRTCERAEQLADELEDFEPRPGRVRKAWDRLLPALGATKSGFDAVNQIGSLISQFTS